MIPSDPAQGWHECGTGDSMFRRPSGFFAALGLAGWTALGKTEVSQAGEGA
jgi:hypothetical protein